MDQETRAPLTDAAGAPDDASPEKNVGGEASTDEALDSFLSREQEPDRKPKKLSRNMQRNM